MNRVAATIALADSLLAALLFAGNDAGDAALLLRNLEGAAELALKQAVDETELLLLGEADRILGELAARLRAVLARGTAFRPVRSIRNSVPSGVMSRASLASVMSSAARREVFSSHAGSSVIPARTGLRSI